MGKGYCGNNFCGDCADCVVIEDALIERGIDLEDDGFMSLVYGLTYNQQDDWKLKDVAAVPVAVTNGENEPNFTWVIGFTDGRWAAVRGWHDYTGWDCQSGIKTEWYPTQDAAMRTLVDWEREALGGK